MVYWWKNRSCRRPKETHLQFREFLPLSSVDKMTLCPDCSPIWNLFIRFISFILPFIVCCCSWVVVFSNYLQTLRPSTQDANCFLKSGRQSSASCKRNLKRTIYVEWSRSPSSHNFKMCARYYCCYWFDLVTFQSKWFNRFAP